MNSKADINLGRVGVVFGGTSSERDISIKSGAAVTAALERAGIQVCPIDLQTTDAAEIAALLKDKAVEIVFIAMHGKFGEDGQLQAILESIGIPYTGSGQEASRLMMDKAATLERLRDQHFKIPEYRIVSKADCDKMLSTLIEADFPLVVKPVAEGSSIGLSLATAPEQLKNALKEAFQYGQLVLVEKFIKGRELTVGILGDQALPVIEIKFNTSVFDFKTKYQKGLSECIVPAKLSVEVTRGIQQAAIDTFRLLGCRDMARLDYIFAEDGNAYFLEANSIPGFTDVSLLPLAARHAGVSFEELCARLCLMAARRGAVSRKE